GAVRLRFYAAAGVDPATLTRSIAFNAVAFAVGIVTSGALATLWAADQAAAIAHVPPIVLQICAALAMIGLGVLLWQCKRGTSPLPSLSIALRQLLFSIIDIVASAAALWVLLPPD